MCLTEHFSVCTLLCSFRFYWYSKQFLQTMNFGQQTEQTDCYAVWFTIINGGKRSKWKSNECNVTIKKKCFRINAICAIQSKSSKFTSIVVFSVYLSKMEKLNEFRTNKKRRYESIALKMHGNCEFVLAMFQPMATPLTICAKPFMSAQWEWLNVGCVRLSWLKRIFMIIPFSF